MDFVKALADVQKAKTEAIRAAEALEKAETVVQEGIKGLADACRPSCIRAIEKYNAQTSLRISTNPSELKLSFSAEKMLVGLSVILRDLGGREPDEEFYASEVEDINKELKPIMNKELKKDGIPFKFSGISVPSGYYMK